MANLDAHPSVCRGWPAYHWTVMVHLAPVPATIVLMLLVSLLVPALASPIALACGAAVTLGVTFIKDRRLAMGFAVVSVLGLAVIAWVMVQPAYVESVLLF